MNNSEIENNWFNLPDRTKSQIIMCATMREHYGYQIKITPQIMEGAKILSKAFVSASLKYSSYDEWLNTLYKGELETVINRFGDIINFMNIHHKDWWKIEIIADYQKWDVKQ